MQAILHRRWDEVQRCIRVNAHLAATVMMGGLLESLLLARINASPIQSAVYTAKQAPRDKANKTVPLNEWKLAQMIEVAHELRWITKSAKDVGHVLRDFRNYIHPHKEFAAAVVISAGTPRCSGKWRRRSAPKCSRRAANYPELHRPCSYPMPIPDVHPRISPSPPPIFFAFRIFAQSRHPPPPLPHSNHPPPRPHCPFIRQSPARRPRCSPKPNPTPIPQLFYPNKPAPSQNNPKISLKIAR